MKDNIKIKEEFEKMTLDGEFDSKYGSVQFDWNKIADWFLSRMVSKESLMEWAEENRKELKVKLNSLAILGYNQAIDDILALLKEDT